MNPHQDGSAPRSNGVSSRRKKKKSEEFLQIDHIIGDFGRYQSLIFLFKILIGITSSFNNLGVAFFAPTGYIGYSCADNPASAPETQSLGRIFSGLFLGEERASRHSGANFTYQAPSNLVKNCSQLVDGVLQKCTAYKYDTGIWISTIIDEWDLVCDRSKLISFTQSLYMGGFIVAFLIFGYLSDRYGRWRTLMLGASLEIIFGLGCALSTSPAMYMTFRFFLGFGCAGRTSSSYLHLIEWVGPRWRMHMSILGSLGWVAGYCALPWFYLYFLHFRHVQLFACLYESVFLILIFALPESPRWLLTHKRFEEAHATLLRAAKINGLIIKESKQTPLIEGDDHKNGYVLNGVPLVASAPRAADAMNVEGDDDDESDDLDNHGRLRPYTIEEYNVRFRELVDTIERKEFTRNENKLSIIDLLKWNNLRRYAMIICFIWAANSLIYYGIALHVSDFGNGNLFVSFTIAGITELPSMAIAIICMKLLPRKAANLFIFATTGLICALQLPLKYYNYQVLQQVSMMFAKLFNSSSFEMIRYQSMELFPTSIRQTALSTCSLVGRVGSILAPFVKELAQATNSYVPPAIYAFLYLLASLLIRGLPETKGSDFSDTLVEAENFKGTNQARRRSSNHVAGAGTV